MNEQQPQTIEVSRVLEVLAKGDMAIETVLPYSSNYTLLATITYEELQVLAVYKPRRGERPLWDFTRGTLYRREVAAYLVSEALGFGLVPPTVLLDGRLWAIDHGICFHHEPKLRTVLWDFVGQALPPEVIAALRAFRARLDAGDAVAQTLGDLLDKVEVRALRRRLDHLLTTGVFPPPGPGPNVPWPPV
jgi:hypothetical protein